jgi:hypothetical protein
LTTILSSTMLILIIKKLKTPHELPADADPAISVSES